MPGTPNPTLEERQRDEVNVNGDVGAAIDELLVRLRVLLPESIAAENILREWTTPATQITVPGADDISMAPSLVSSENIDKILVGAQLDTVNGPPGVMWNTLNVVVFSIDTVAKVAQDYRKHWRRAELIRRDLFGFLNGCANADGIEVWSQLIPGPVAMLPADFHAEFSGMSVRFSMRLPEGIN